MRVLVLASLALVACSEEVQHGPAVQLFVSRTDCGGADVAASATHWRLRVLRAGALVDEFTGTSSQAVPSLVRVSDDGAVALRLEAFDGPPDTGRLVAWGQSRTLEPGTATNAILTVSLAPVEQFVDTCVRLQGARAGHSATVLHGSRVYVIGGQGGGATPAVLGTIEELDPAARTAETAGALSLSVNGSIISMAMADHAATALNSGQVLLWGGWRATPQGPSSTSVVLVWDADLRETGAVPNGQNSASRHGHSLLRVGEQLFALGGMKAVGANVEPVESVERLEASMQRSVVGTVLPAMAGTAWSALDGGAVVAGGELAAGGVSNRLAVLRLGSAIDTTWSGTLATPRARATGTPLGDGALIAGGADGQGAALGSTEWLRGSSPPVLTAGPAIAPRESPCAAALWDGRVLLLGGAAAGQPSAAAELVDPSGVARAVTFPGPPRQRHTCTRLDDGSVLIVGGLTAGNEVLGDAWRYVPMPPPLAP
jgi:hypothetical protein